MRKVQNLVLQADCNKGTNWHDNFLVAISIVFQLHWIQKVSGNKWSHNILQRVCQIWMRYRLELLSGKDHCPEFINLFKAVIKPSWYTVPFISIPDKSSYESVEYWFNAFIVKGIKDGTAVTKFWSTRDKYLRSASLRTFKHDPQDWQKLRHQRQSSFAHV